MQSLERVESDMGEMSDRASELERQNKKLETMLEEKREVEEEVRAEIDIGPSPCR